MNNEPVAWMRESDKAVCSNEEKLWFIEEEGSNWNYVIPLYTHQAKEYTPNQTLECSFDLAGFKPPVKELTDEEIKHLASNCFVDWKGQHIIDFARAILKKASEK